MSSVTGVASGKTSALIVFIKAPTAGHVKTRLASTIGEDAALRVYMTLAEHVVASTRTLSTNVDVLLFVDSVEAQSTVARWINGEVRLQEGDELGARLAHAFTQCFASYDNVVVIGSDAPFVSPFIDDAFEALRKHDCVIGPAFDGGYYLIGLKRTTRNWRDLFADVTWSTSLVFMETIRNAREAEIDVHVLPAMHDVDTVADMRAIVKAYPGTDLAVQFYELLHTCESATEKH